MREIDETKQQEMIRCAEIAESFMNNHWKEYLAYRNNNLQLAKMHKDKYEVARLIYNEILEK